jgi:hypothetical protein
MAARIAGTLVVATKRRAMIRITKRRLAIGFGFLLIVLGGYCLVQLWRGYTISTYRIPHFSVPPNESSAERSGLRVTVKGVQRKEDMVAFTYALEWVPVGQNENQMGFMRPFGKMHVIFWDADGKEVFAPSPDPQDQGGRMSIWYGVSLDFIAEAWPYLDRHDVLITPPQNAKFIAISILGYKTNRIPIPDP